MNSLRVMVLALVTMLAGMLVPGSAQPAAAVDVYITPGTHLVNGRQWKTECKPYSTRITRCRTDIWATVISRDATGNFRQSVGWAFNNLTYKAVDHKLWGNNPLANNGEWTAADGRRWRTECGTALTGKDGCRSFILATVYSLQNGTFVEANQWVFNNMVRLVPGTMKSPYPTAAPMKAAPTFLQGRRYFALGIVVTQPNVGAATKGLGRISRVELDPQGKLGTFVERYWTYTFDMAIESDYGQFRTSIPTLPKGCLSSSKDAADRRLLKLPALPAGACDVRGARTFMGSPATRTGTYEALAGNQIKLYWDNSAVTETYRDATPSGQRYSELQLAANTHPSALNAQGFMFGSKKLMGAGRSFAPQISQQPWQPPRSSSKGHTIWAQTIGSSVLTSVYASFRFLDYVPVTGSGCIVSAPANRARPAGGWHSYFCPLPSDGKVVWQNMGSYLVAEGHGLCPAYVAGTSWADHRRRCEAASPAAVDYTIPARLGGHVLELLQVVDDADQLTALVGLETSLYSNKLSSQSQLALVAAIAYG